MAASEATSLHPWTTRHARRAATWHAFRALLLRDFTVLDKDLRYFLPGTLMQPLLLVFVFTYLFPTIGQAVGGVGGAARFSSLMMAGMVAQSIVFQGIFRVAVPTVRELDITHELDDRMLAPTAISVIALEKIAFGALQSLFAALIVFPVAAFVPATPVYLQPRWPLLISVLVLACITSGAFGLTLATVFEPRTVPYLSSVIFLPLSFGGAVFYTWTSLEPIPWLQYAILANPLLYMSEGLRAALVSGVPHMPLPLVLAGLLTSSVVLTTLSIYTFKRRVLA